MECSLAIPRMNPFLPASGCCNISIIRVLREPYTPVLEDIDRLTRNHSFLIGGNGPHGNTAVPSGDALRAACVGLRVEDDAEPAGGLAHPTPDLRRMLTNPRREHQGIEPAERRG